MPNPKDVIRDILLRHLYRIHTTAKSRKNVATGIMDLRKVMKKKELTVAQVVSNLDYLIQKRWVREETEKKTFTTPRGTTRVSESKKYKISDLGIDALEGGSIYNRENILSKIDVTNISGVVVIGNRNIVSAEYTDFSRALSELEEIVTESQRPSHEDKLSVIADLGTIQSQISKPKPNNGVIKTVWGGIKKILRGAEFISYLAKISELVDKLPVD